MAARNFANSWINDCTAAAVRLASTLMRKLVLSALSDRFMALLLLEWSGQRSTGRHIAQDQHAGKTVSIKPRNDSRKPSIELQRWPGADTAVPRYHRCQPLDLEPGERITHVFDREGIPQIVEQPQQPGAWFLPAALFTMLGFIVGWLAGQGVLS